MKTTIRAVAFMLIAGFVFAQTVSAQQKKLTVSGIPAAYNGKAALLYLISGGNHAAWAAATISGGSASCNLLDWVTDQPWNANGNYQVAFLIYNSLQEATANPANSLWTGATVSTAVTQANTTVRWSEFIETSSSSGPNLSLEGEWADHENPGARRIRVSGTTGVLAQEVQASGPDWSGAPDYQKIGGTQWRNLKSTGNLTWQGEALEVIWKKSPTSAGTSILVATSTRWVKCKITMSADGKTITVNGVKWIRR